MEKSQTSQIASFLMDKTLLDEVKKKVGSGKELPKSRQWNIEPKNISVMLEPESPVPETFSSRPYTEAIILQFGRPALLVTNDGFEVPESDEWKARLYPTKSKIEKSVKSVGRLELLEHPSFDWVGTGWLVAEDIIVTNRHVAMEFAEKKGQEFVFSHNPLGKTIGAKIDFKEEYKQDTTYEAAVKKVIFMADMGSEYPDMAFLMLEEVGRLPDPIPLLTRRLNSGSFVATIGYPARDPRNDYQAMAKVFGDIYDVKRLCPGMLTGYDNGFVVTHDCSTLGGNSGSAIIDIETGNAIGLHFGGRFQQANYAVAAATICNTLTRLNIKIPVAKMPGIEIDMHKLQESKSTKPKDYENRQGYQADFLGVNYLIPLPELSASLKPLAVALNGPGAAESKYILDYTHFSLTLHKGRKMAIFTACNIDGSDLWNIPRKRDVWRFDPRIDSAFQAGEELYSDNDFDRGHLVRRLDPVWGTKTVASRANDDTFHFTNCTPQHKDFNQKTWNELEDYILDNAGAESLRVSVFTGPIFAETDILYRGYYIPSQYWKVAVIVKDDDKKISATAYILSQNDLLTNLEFVYGQFKTYQVPIAQIEEMTGLEFGSLKDFDPLAAIEGRPFKLIESLQQITL